MKTKFNLTIAITAMLIGIAIIFNGCKKDDDNAVKYFSVSFQDGYSEDYGWVVLHNLEGTEVVDYKKIEGDGIADFGDINGGKVTATIIRVDTFGYNKGYERKYIDIASDYSSPCGNWVFKGSNYSGETLGTANITMTYPSNYYDEYFLITTDDWDYSNDVPYNEVTIQDNVYYLDDGNKYSIYGAVIKDNGGYCNWLLDQNFQIDQANYYNLELTKPLDDVSFVSSMPLNYFYLYGSWNQRNSDLLLYRRYYGYTTQDGETYHDAYLPLGMPLSELMFSSHYYGEYNSYNYGRFFNMPQGLPGNIEIPDKTVTAVYDESTDEITDIQINGTADQIAGRWYYWEYSDTTQFNIYWHVYANWDRQSIKRPVLPQEIMDDIGGEINMLEPSSVRLLDYNTTSSHSDIINRFFIDDVPYSQKYDERFSYSHNLDQDKNRDNIERDRERHETHRQNNGY